MDHVIKMDFIFRNLKYFDGYQNKSHMRKFLRQPCIYSASKPLKLSRNDLGNKVTRLLLKNLTVTLCIIYYN